MSRLAKIITGIAVMTATAAAAPAQAAALTSCPAVVAHRTAMKLAPENTVPGVAAAASTGAAVVEMDVQWSSSHFPVLMHDSTVDRTTNGTGTPDSMGLSQLTALLAQDYAPWKSDPRFSDTHVPYGWDFMNAVATRGLDVMLDIHAMPDRADMDKLVYYIDAFSWRSHTIILGSAAQIQTMRPWYPSLRYTLIEYPPNGRIATPEYLKSIGASGYAIPISTSVTPGLGSYMHASGITLAVWTSDSDAKDVQANWDTVAAADADYLITNYPAAAKARYASTCIA